MRPQAAALSLLLSITAVGCIGDDPEVDEIAALTPAGSGNVSLEWSIYEGDAVRACAETAAVEVAITFLSDDVELSETIDCASGTGETTNVPSGDYDVTVSLVDREGGEMAVLPLGPYSVESDRTTPLGHVDLFIGAK